MQNEHKQLEDGNAIPLTELKRVEQSRIWKEDQEFSFEHDGCEMSIRQLEEMSRRQLNNQVWRE